MAVEPIPINIKRFILDTIHSVEALEILLLLRAHPNKEWIAAEVSRELYTSTDSAARRLQELKKFRLLAAQEGGEPRYRFAPATTLLTEQTDALEKIYRERRVSVISLIYSKPSDPIRDFSDAFRLRKDEE